MYAWRLKCLKSDMQGSRLLLSVPRLSQPPCAARARAEFCVVAVIIRWVQKPTQNKTKPDPRIHSLTFSPSVVVIMLRKCCKKTVYKNRWPVQVTG